MEPTPPPATEEYACASCGTRMHISREECPWCGTPTPLAESPTQTLNAPSLNGAATNGRNGLPTGHAMPAQTMALAAVGDMPTATLDHPVYPSDAQGDAAEPIAPAPRGRRFWFRLYGWALLALLVGIIGFGAAGVLQGLNDREVTSTNDAIVAYERGRELVEEEQYDLALAYFREAVRLEPNFPAAEQMMAYAENQMLVVPPVDAPANASPTATIPNDEAAAELFEQGTAALADSEWLAAADAFNTLRTDTPDYRPDEVSDGLFNAYVGLGEAALAEEDLDDALLNFELALQIRPNDSAVSEARRLTSSYRTALQAFERERWGEAANQFRAVYVIAPTFLDVADNLKQSHLELGNAFAEREIWCDAAQNFRAALTISPDTAVSNQALAAEQKCSVVAPPARATSTPSTSNNPTPDIDATPTITGTIRGTPIPLIPTPGANATATPVPAAPSGSGYVAGGVVENLGDGCFGRYILGGVYNAAGAPVPGVTLLLIDEFGNRATAVTKDDPAGIYDLAIGANATSYQLMVVSGDQVLSTGVMIRQSEAAIAAPVACYTVNWQQR